MAWTGNGTFGVVMDETKIDLIDTVVDGIVTQIGTPADTDIATDIANLDTVVDGVETKVDTAISDIGGVKTVVDAITGYALEATIGTPIDTDIATDIANVLSAVNAGFALTGDAVVANVLDGKFFYKDDFKTKLEGTMPNNAGAVACVSASITAGTTLSVIPAAGYTDGSDDTSTIDLTTVDADLVTGNIKAGITILGVAGKTEVVDTTEAVDPAAEGDIALGKIAWVNGVKITGTHV